MRYAILTVATLLILAPAARALVVSDHVGSHTTTPGVPAFGVNIDGVVHLVMDDGAPLASGALITDRHVLTVAHAVDLDEDGTIDPLVIDALQVVFNLPGGSVTVNVEAAIVPDEWSNLPWSEAMTHDIAVLTLADDAPAAAPRYPLYGGNQEVGQRVVVTGYGITGHGSVGMEDRGDDLLAGLNRYEVDSVEFFFDLMAPTMLLYDFDSGLVENNALEFLEIPSDLGFGDDEVAAARGDSGGPVFLGGAIAGVSASGLGATAFDPFPPDVTSITDSSWGEVLIDTRVSYFRDFLTTATGGQARFVPEPSTVLLTTTACVLACSYLSRRNRRQAGKRGQRGEDTFAGKARRVLRTKGSCPLFLGHQESVH